MFRRFAASRFPGIASLVAVVLVLPPVSAREALAVAGPSGTDDAELAVELVGVGADGTSGTLGSGTVRRAGSLGFEYDSGGERLQVRGTMAAQDEKTIFTVRVEDPSGVRFEHAHDLSDWRARSIELPGGGEGSVLLNVFPRHLPGEPAPVELTEGAGEFLGHWSFRESPIVLDDQHYAGRIVFLIGGHSLWLEIPGEVHLVLDLFDSPGLQPIGTLRNGKLDVKGPDDRTIQVFQVSLGDPAVPLEGRTIRVYGRWEPPRSTREEAAERHAAGLAKWRPDLTHEQVEESADRMRSGFSVSYGTP
ncbi:MAG: hypothetical protein R3E97_06540 [Candidatus Eisenbacteria bacterium]